MAPPKPESKAQRMSLRENPLTRMLAKEKQLKVSTSIDTGVILGATAAGRFLCISIMAFDGASTWVVPYVQAA